jgi:hypothetical protein
VSEIDRTMDALAKGLVAALAVKRTKLPAFQFMGFNVILDESLPEGVIEIEDQNSGERLLRMENVGPTTEGQRR